MVGLILRFSMRKFMWAGVEKDNNGSLQKEFLSPFAGLCGFRWESSSKRQPEYYSASVTSAVRGVFPLSPSRVVAKTPFSFLRSIDWLTDTIHRRLMWNSFDRLIDWLEIHLLFSSLVRYVDWTQLPCFIDIPSTGIQWMIIKISHCRLRLLISANRKAISRSSRRRRAMSDGRVLSHLL